MHTWLREAIEEYVTFTNKEWNFLIQMGKTIHLKPNELFIRTGAITNKIGFLKKGIMRACVENTKGEMVTSYFYYLPNNNIVSLHTSYTTQTPSDYCVEAITDCEILYFTRKDIDFCLKKYPKIEVLIRKIAEKQYMINSRRICDFQTKNAKELYDAFLSETGDLSSKIPQYMIASYLGMSQYTLSKIKK